MAFEKLSDDFGKKLKEVENQSEGLVDKISNMNKLISEKRKIVVNVYKDREFEWSNNMQTKLESFKEIEDIKSITSELYFKKMRFHAQAKQRAKCMENLLKYPWFAELITKLKENAKRTGQQIPLSCLKLLVIFNHLIVTNWTLTSQIFYDVIESCITDPQEHAKIIVHKILKAFRDALNIGPEAFLKYLNDKNIQPCAELLSQVRKIKRKRARNLRIQSQRRPVRNLSSSSFRRPGSSSNRSIRPGSSQSQDGSTTNLGEFGHDDEFSDDGSGDFASILSDAMSEVDFDDNLF